MGVWAIANGTPLNESDSDDLPRAGPRPNQDQQDEETTQDADDDEPISGSTILFGRRTEQEEIKPAVLWGGSVCYCPYSPHRTLNFEL